MVMYPVNEFDEKITLDRVNRNDDPNRPVRYVPDKTRWYRLDPEPVIPATGRLVLNFGDSSTFGWGLQNQADAYPGVLNKLLKNTRSINLGVPGYSSLQGLLYVQLMIPKLHNRLAAITLYFGNNDGTENGLSDLDRVSNQLQPTVVFVRKWCPLCRLLQDVWVKERRYHQDQPRVNPDRFANNLRQMISIAQRYGVPVIVIRPPVRLGWQPGHLIPGESLEEYVQNRWTYRELQLAKSFYRVGSYRDALEHDWVIPRLKQAWSKKLENLTVPVVHLPAGDIRNEGRDFIDYCHPSRSAHYQIAHKIMALWQGRARREIS